MQRQKVLACFAASLINRSLLSRGARGGRQQFNQSRFTSAGSIFVDDPTLGGLIDGRNHSVHIFRGRFRRRTRDTLLHSSQTSNDLSIARGTDFCLTGAFGSGSRVSHLEM